MVDVDARKTRGPRGEYAKSSVTRSLILDAALEVFAESGYRAGSLRDIAARVGMSDAGMLHHFRNKSALLQAVLDRRDERSLNLVDFEAADPAFALRGLVDLAAYNASVPGVVELYTTLSAEATSPTHPAHEYFKRRYEFTRSNTVVVFQRLASADRIPVTIDPFRAAVATLALMDGLQVQWLLDRDLIDMAQELEDFFASFVRDFPRRAEQRADATEVRA
jgi:AcrR family transcriptional regulator